MRYIFESHLVNLFMRHYICMRSSGRGSSSLKKVPIGKPTHVSRIRLLVTFAFMAAVVAAVMHSRTLLAPPQPSIIHVPPEITALDAMPISMTMSGNYLAGRFAQRQQDWNSAQNYINAVLDFDRQNPALDERAFLLSLGAQQYDRARNLAQKLVDADRKSDLAYIYLASDALSHNDFDTALALLKQLPEDGFGQYTKPLLTAWTLAGQGQTDAAIAMLRTRANAYDPTYNIHAALIEDMAGHKDQAAIHFDTAIDNGVTLHGAMLAANFFDKNGQKEKAAKIHARLGKIYPLGAQGLAHENNSIGIERAAEGAGVALFDLATLLYEKRAYDSAQVYGSLVQLLYPNSPFVLMMMGDIAALNEQYDKALHDYAAIPASSSMFWFSRMRMAEINEARGRSDLSEKILIDLAKRAETRSPALVTLGDMYRRQSRFADAIRVYDEALGTSGAKSAENWSVIYARGMALERTGHWPRAEEDLLTALELQPDNPMILNYIGYSWLEKGMNLDKAVDYTRRAATLKPDDGYILDSYGWALYRTGKRADAVEWLERAVEAIPDDSTILDHLGDAYWQTGRVNEARFKWRRAQELSKDAVFKTAIQKKIRHGVEDTPTVASHVENKI